MGPQIGLALSLLKGRLDMNACVCADRPRAVALPPDPQLALEPPRRHQVRVCVCVCVCVRVCVCVCVLLRARAACVRARVHVLVKPVPSAGRQAV